MIEYYYGVERQWQPVLPELGLGSSDDVFSNPKIQVWRSIPERENGVLDVTLDNGRALRLHVKRYHRVRARRTPGETEAEAIFLLQRAKIPTVPLVAWGWLPDRRSFIISEDLAGYEAADKLVEQGTVPFERLLEPIAALAGDLHRAGLHHRDLYLCHFFVKVENGIVADVRLIDAARVRPVPRLFGKRWIVKDLAQLWYSTLPLAITDEQRQRLLALYAAKTGASIASLRPAIEKKARWIADHDARLRAKQPDRNVSIPAGNA